MSCQTCSPSGNIVFSYGFAYVFALETQKPYIFLGFPALEAPRGTYWGWTFQASHGTIVFLHILCFHKLLQWFLQYPKPDSEPGREP